MDVRKFGYNKSIFPIVLGCKGGGGLIGGICIKIKKKRQERKQRRFVGYDWQIKPDI
ncbi:hypothetical protein ACIQWQ_26075 [Peribacillus frigoritolerans]